MFFSVQIACVYWIQQLIELRPLTAFFSDWGGVVVAAGRESILRAKSSLARDE